MKNILGRLRLTVIIGVIIFAVGAVLYASTVELNSTYTSVLQIDANRGQQVEIIGAVKRYDDASRDLNRMCWQYQAYEDTGFLDSYIEKAYVEKSKEKAFEEIQGFENNEEEKEYLEKVKDASQIVSNTELYAMRILADGLNVDTSTLPPELMEIQLSEEDKKLNDADKIEKSHALVNTESYGNAIQEITDGLESYSVARSQRYGDISSSYVNTVLKNITLQKIYLIVSGILLVVSALIAYITIGKPINEYLRDISKGGAELNTCTPRGAKEFRNFAEAYNEAVSKYHGETEKLKREIEIRHLLEKSSETVTVIYDLENKVANISDESCILMDKAETNLTYEELLELIRNRVCESDIEMMSMRNGYVREGSRNFRACNKEGKVVWFNSWYMFVMEENSPTMLISTVRNVDESVKRTIKLEKMSQTDLKTGLLNSVSASVRINEFLTGEGQDSSHSLLIVDIDDFKKVNDTLGHKVGDETLLKIAQILQNNFRANDIVGRLGGDEFIVFVKDVPDEETLAQKMSQLIKELHFVAVGDGKEIEVTASIGHANYDKDNKTFDDLYEEADKNLYRAKDLGKNQVI